MNEGKVSSVTGLATTAVGYKIMIYKYIANVLLLKDLLENQRTKFTNMLLQYQKLRILIN